MTLFIIGVVLTLTSFVAPTALKKLKVPKVGSSALLRHLACLPVLVCGIVLTVASTAIYVQEDQGGIINRKFGPDLEKGAIIATNGEKGSQAYVLPPGWHFGYWPWLFDLKVENNKDIDRGKIGVLTAKDGVPLPDGDIYAAEWENPQDMLDGMNFLTSGDGHKGPQLTVLPPGQYRYNPRLFKISEADATPVDVGYVATVKSNAGEEYVPEEGEDVETVNGVPIVPNGYRGIWKDALTPNEYYLHPNAYKVTKVKTTKRVYSYTASNRVSAESDRPGEDNSVEVKTKDGFKFPVDVRVSVKIDAEDAPYVVAMLGDPDADDNDDGFDVLEERAILPSIRSIFRNTAEDKSALEYINSRSQIEADATEKFIEDMKEFRIQVDRVYIADIGLDKTPEGKELLRTQTDKEIAVQQEETYRQKEQAELQRATMVRAQEAADQEKNKEAAKAKVEIARSEAEAKEELAKGEAAAYREKIKAFGGVNEYIRALMIEKLVDAAPEITLPRILVVGGGSSAANEALLTPVLSEMADEAERKKAQ